jgi:hypothetical protein
MLRKGSFANSRNLDEIVPTYALVNSIMLFGFDVGARGAEEFVKTLVERFGERNMSLDQMRSIALAQHANPLNDFALKCRAESRATCADRSRKGA